MGPQAESVLAAVTSHLVEVALQHVEVNGERGGGELTVVHQSTSLEPVIAFKRIRSTSISGW
jgi:hypothetical protein